MELTDERQRRGGVQHSSEPGLERSLRRAKLAQTPADGRQIEERAHDIEDDCASDHGLSYRGMILSAWSVPAPTT